MKIKNCLIAKSGQDLRHEEEVGNALTKASHLLRLLILSPNNDYFVFVGMKRVDLLNVCL